MEIEREAVQRDPATGSVETVHTQEHVASAATVNNIQADRAGSYVWYVAGFIEVLLVMRFVFLLLGAVNTGFAAFLYQITLPFMSLFRGIFPAPGNETGYFDTATILAMVVYALIGWGIVSLININRHAVVA